MILSVKPEKEKGKQMEKQTKQLVLNVEELEERVAPTILLTNPAGNHPQGTANGEAIDYENPAGQAPPGWNK